MKLQVIGLLFISSAALATEQGVEGIDFATQMHSVGPLNCLQVTAQLPDQHSKVSCPEDYSVLSGGCLHTTGGPDLALGAEDLLRTSIDVGRNGWVCSSSHVDRKYVARALCCR
jgi:hypothetical protein